MATPAATLVVAVSGLWEPLLGSVLGFLVGVQGVPGATTLVAGPLLVAGCLLTTLGARDAGFDAKRLCGGGRGGGGGLGGGESGGTSGGGGGGGG